MIKVKKIIVGLAIGSMLVGLTACASQKEAENQEDILSQKTSEPNRTQITISVKPAFSINNFEKVVEEKFPNIDLVLVGNFSHNMGIDEMEARLKHDDLTDIVMTWPAEVGEEYFEERLIDLSGMDFTNRYNISMLNDISQNGKLYYIPGPAQIRGIVYNKTLFEENGWEVPSNYEEFISLCKTIEATGIRSIQLGFENREVLDTAFIGYNYGSYFSRSQDMAWLEDYYNGKNDSFGTHFKGALELFNEMVQEGIWKNEDLQVDYSDREVSIFNRKSAMTEDSPLLAKLGKTTGRSEDEFALMPFFNPGEDGDWARIYMVCFLGLNKHLLDSENSKKYQLVLELMDYISTPEGQELLASDTGAMYSSLSESNLSGIPEIEEMVNALNHGRYAIFKGLHPAVQEGLSALVRQEVSVDECIQLIDSSISEQEDNLEVNNVYGQANKSFSLIETNHYVADAIRESAGSEIALVIDNGKDGFPNGKGLSGRIYEGDITDKDIERIMPDYRSGDTGTLLKISMTGRHLLETLEHSILVDGNTIPWFYYASGITMEFDPKAKGGSRVKSISLSDGTPIEMDRIYTIAVADNIVDDKFILDKEDLNISIRDVLVNKIKRDQTISPPKDNRLVIVNNRD